MNAPAVDVKVFPSSFTQRRLWMLDRLYDQRAAYNVTSAFHVTGPLDAARLQRSLDAIVLRHETLRTCFRFEAGDLAQVIHPALSVPIDLWDWRDRPGHAKVAAAASEAARDAARPFDLERVPLLRASLYRLDDLEFLLAFCFHHAIFDGWSESVFLRELAALYRSGDRQTAGDALADLPVQYSQFATWQRELTTGPAAEADLELWRQKLTGAPRVLNLPLDYPRPHQPTHRGSQELLLIPEDRVEALTAVGRQCGATLFMTLLAAYAVVLHRYSGDREVMIGTALAGRSRPELEGLIGFFVNTVALRADLGGNPTFVEVLDRIKRVALESYSHQDVPFDHVVESLHPDRTTGHTPLFQTIFVLQSASESLPSFGNLRMDPLSIHNGSSKCDLLLSIGKARDGRDGLCCSLEYDLDLFRPATAARLLESYRAVIDAVGQAGRQPVATLPMVGSTDWALLKQWNDTALPYPRESTIHREFEATAARNPAAVAVTLQSQSLTYAQLEAQSNRLARRLRSEGVGRTETVGMCFERSIEAIVAFLAVLKAGAAYVPLDPSYPLARLRVTLQDAGIRVVLSHAKTAGLLRQLEAERVIDLDEQSGAIARESSERVANDGRAEDLAYIMYTSGSTGRPNGVRIPHRAVLRLILGASFVNWERATTFLQMAPMGFDAATFEIWGALLRGKRLVLFPDRVPTIALLEKVLQTEGVDCLWLPSALFNSVIDERAECLTGVSQLIVGGEALSVAHIRRAQARLPSSRLMNGYGPTECATFACCYSIPRLDDSHAGSIPIGRPIGNTSVQVLSEQRQPVPIGVMGELYIGGDAVGLGYHDRPALTAQRFVADPSGRTAGLWYRTGDRVRWTADGVLEFHGRLDEQIKVRGFRVEPGEIEAACRLNPSVRDAAVVLQTGGSTDPRLVAFITGEPGLASRTRALRHSLEEQLPGHLVPAELRVIDLLPVTSNGKVDRQALSAMARGGVENPPENGNEPKSPIEHELSRIWCDLLQLPSVGRHDDFFSLGGHSLLAVRMFARIHAAFGRSLPFSTLLRHSTIAELAALLQPAHDVSKARCVSLVPLKPEGRRPPLLLLHGIGNEVWTYVDLARLLDAEQPVYGVLSQERNGKGPATIAEMAAGYVADIEVVFPDGPIVVGGHCSGAVLAFEVARQLRARHRPVPLMVVFDYSLEEVSVGARPLFVNALNWVADDLLRRPLRDNIGRARSRLRMLRSRLSSLGIKRARTDDIRDLLGMWRYPDHEVRRLQQDLDALRSYAFTRYDAPIHVFRARTRPLRARQPNGDLGWGRVAAGSLTVDTIPGAHDTIFKPPFVRTLGARLNTVLQRTFAKPSAPEFEDSGRGART